MHLPTHLVISWLIGHRLDSRRDRVLVAWSGVAADVDSLSILGGLDTYGEWHHVLTHGIVAAALTAILVAFAAASRARAAALAFVAFHVHLLCDLLGSGREWSITYLFPFDRHETFTPYGWSLGSWQNIAITIVAFGLCAVIGVRRGRTFAEAWLPLRADRAIVQTLRARFLAGDRREA